MNKIKGINIKAVPVPSLQITAKVTLDLRKASDTRSKAFSPLQSKVTMMSPNSKQPKNPPKHAKTNVNKKAPAENIKQIKGASSMSNLNQKQQTIYDKLKRKHTENADAKSETTQKTAQVNITTISSVEITGDTKRKGKSTNLNNFSRLAHKLENESINILENAQKQKKILIKNEENFWSKITSIFTPFSCGNPQNTKLK